MLELNDVSFRYADSEHGVKHIDLRVNRGECVVVTGPSGGGKSTIARLINGLAPSHFAGEVSGSIKIAGVDVNDMEPWARAQKVGSVFQDPKSQFFSSELAGEVAFACENCGFAHEDIVYRTDTAIAAFALDELRERSLDVLSSGEKQRVCIASVCALSPGVIVCDEPTANLDDESALKLAQTFAQLKAQGCTLIIAEHRLAWLHGIADRFVYVRDGQILWDQTADDAAKLTDDERRKYGLRSALPMPMPTLPAPRGGTVPIIEAEGVSCKMGGDTIFENKTFRAWPGQIIAITGRNGAGKTTFAHVLSGLQRERGGRILINGQALKPYKRGEHIWYGSNDTSTQFFTSGVGDELLLMAKKSPDLLERARRLLKRLGLYEYRDAHPATLSGGQKQRLCVACGILSDRSVLMLDEPTSGLDAENMLIIASVLKETAAAGKTILIITHDSELIAACCGWRYGFGP